MPTLSVRWDDNKKIGTIPFIPRILVEWRPLTSVPERHSAKKDIQTETVLRLYCMDKPRV